MINFNDFVLRCIYYYYTNKLISTLRVSIDVSSPARNLLISRVKINKNENVFGVIFCVQPITLTQGFLEVVLGVMKPDHLIYSLIVI